MTDYAALPPDLPAPEDDGAADHLVGTALPPLALPATDGTRARLADLDGRSVVYCYPMTGAPDNPPPDGWDLIPGARGCTPQSCSFRDHHAELQALGARVFGLSTQRTSYQREAAERLHLPFPLLSDSRLELAGALALPTFDNELLPKSFGPSTLLKRLTMIVRDGRIEHVFYPVFPPDRNADEVISWLTRPPDASVGRK
ncbi:MAG TPA: peroxiredoxin [Acidimicrobiia bacterium]|nr:peroxiredoxin [Acidimicrobiia bacterium]